MLLSSLLICHKGTWIIIKETKLLHKLKDFFIKDLHGYIATITYNEVVKINRNNH